MPMIDLHANSSGGGTSLTAISTIAAGGDGQTVAGVPIAPTPVLAYWGGFTTIADTIKQLQLTTQDQWDPINGENFLPGASSLAGIINKSTWIPYKTGQRNVSMSQNTAGANNIAYYIDYSPANAPVAAVRLSKHIPNQITLWTTLGADTAITWNTGNAFAPTTAIPNGYYAILGCWVNALTNYGLVRFRHADFGLFRPGFPVLDQTNTAVANAVLPKDEFLLYQGYQFIHLCRMLNAPVCPVFRATNAGTGLSFDALTITTDTPMVGINIAKVADLNAVIS